MNCLLEAIGLELGRRYVPTVLEWWIVEAICGAYLGTTIGKAVIKIWRKRRMKTVE